MSLPLGVPTSTAARDERPRIKARKREALRRFGGISVSRSRARRYIFTPDGPFPM